MRAVVAFLLFLIAVSTVEAQQRKQPQTNQNRSDAWCRDAQIDDSGGGPRICMAYTLEQCLASRVTPNERCYPNPVYDPRFNR